MALTTPEPRIHFALVCGAKSCPPIKTYSPQVLDGKTNATIVLQTYMHPFIETVNDLQPVYTRTQIRINSNWFDFARSVNANRIELIRF